MVLVVLCFLRDSATAAAAAGAVVHIVVAWRACMSRTSSSSSSSSRLMTEIQVSGQRCRRADGDAGDGERWCRRFHSLIQGIRERIYLGILLVLMVATR